MKVINISLVSSIFLLASVFSASAAPAGSECVNCGPEITAAALISSDLKNKEIKLACSKMNPLNCGGN